jgi:cytochrome c oxidase subunit 1
VLSIIAGGVDTGWTFYTPYSTTTDADHWRVFFMILAAFILGFSSILTGLNFIVTTHKLRAPGMGWFDMPLLIWALYSTSIIQVLATPVIGITLLLLMVERVLPHRHLRPGAGRRPASVPALLLVLFAPRGVRDDPAGHGPDLRDALGARRKHIFGYRAIAFSSIGIAAVSFIVWGHHMFTAMGELAATLFSALTFLVADPDRGQGVQLDRDAVQGLDRVQHADALHAGRSCSLFSIGGLTGLPLGALATDLHLHDSYFVVAHFHYVMMGGTVIAFIGGIHHWWPKMFGKMYNEKWGIIGCLLVFIGFNVTFFTQFFLGTQGMPRRYATYVDEFQFLHIVSTVGSWVLRSGFRAPVQLHVLAGRRSQGAAEPVGRADARVGGREPAHRAQLPHEPVVRTARTTSRRRPAALRRPRTTRSPPSAEPAPKPAVVK